MKTVYHPTLPVAQDVEDADVNDWVEQGWRKTQPADQETADDNKKGAKS